MKYRWHISFGGPQRKIVVKGKTHHFEMHPYCGPMNTNAKGDPITPLADGHPFWEAVTFWAQTGERVEDGVCVWDRPPQPITEHVAGKHHRVIGYTSAERGA